MSVILVTNVHPDLIKTNFLYQRGICDEICSHHFHPNIYDHILSSVVQNLVSLEPCLLGVWLVYLNGV